MRCEYLNERRLYEYADGQLTGITLSLVREHVESCHPCRASFSAYHSLIAKLGNRTVDEDGVTDAYDPWAPLAHTLSESDWLVFALSDAVTLRDNQSALILVNQNLDRIANLKATDSNAAHLVGYLIVWLVEMGLGNVGAGVQFSYLDLAASALRRFPREPRARLPIADYVQLTLAESLLELDAEHSEDAITKLQRLLHLECEILDPIPVCVAWGGLARAFARLGQYESAADAARHAVSKAQAAGYFELAAAYETRLAWALFQMHGPEHQPVREILYRSAEVLKHTEDAICRGNISAALAKLATHHGLCDEALRLYCEAVDRYEECDQNHPNLARALTNRAQTRLIVVDRLKREQAALAPSDEPAGQTIADILALVREDLDRAEEIYTKRDYVRGRGSVLLTLASLGLCEKNLTLASHQASEAYELGCERRDSILQARARIEQCRIALTRSARAEEKSETPFLLERAREYSEEAVRLAESTQHRRLTVAALTWHGLTLVRPYFDAWREARVCLDRARELLLKGTHDYVHRDLVRLEELVTSGRPGDNQGVSDDRNGASNASAATAGKDSTLRTRMVARLDADACRAVDRGM